MSRDNQSPRQLLVGFALAIPMTAIAIAGEFAACALLGNGIRFVAIQLGALLRLFGG